MFFSTLGWWLLGCYWSLLSDDPAISDSLEGLDAQKENCTRSSLAEISSDFFVFLRHEIYALCSAFYDLESSLLTSSEGLANFTSKLQSATAGAAHQLLEEALRGNGSGVLSLLRLQSIEVIEWFEFSDFQLTLFKELSLILLGNVTLIVLAWKFYGRRISEKFSSSSSSDRKVFEDWRSSMSELQLPQEHDFKFK